MKNKTQNWWLWSTLVVFGAVAPLKASQAWSTLNPPISPLNPSYSETRGFHGRSAVSFSWPDYAEAAGERAKLYCEMSCLGESAVAPGVSNSPRTNVSSLNGLNTDPLALPAITSRDGAPWDFREVAPSSVLGMPNKLAAAPFGPLPGSSVSAERHGVRKGMLALGILGTVGVAAGAVAISESNTNRNCLKSSNNRQVCSDVHTLGEVLIPTSAVVAGLGYFFAFRHAK